MRQIFDRVLYRLYKLQYFNEYSIISQTLVLKFLKYLILQVEQFYINYRN